MSATEMLTEDHQAIRKLFDQYEGAAGESRRRCARSIVAALRVHSSAAEDVFYPALRRVRAPGARTVVREALNQHQRLEALLVAVETAEPDDAGSSEGMKALRDAFEQHVSLEEQRVFGEAHAHFAPERLDKLGSQLRLRRR